MDFGKTYLYKIHKLTNHLDKAFDRTLHNHTEIGLSQFSVLFAIDQFGSVNQQKLADFLEVSTPAISRQIDIARRMGWVDVNPSPTDRHGNQLTLTYGGQRLVKVSVRALEKHLFKIFTDHNRSTTLMEHIDLLNNHTKEVIKEQAAHKIKSKSKALIKIKEKI